MSFNRRDRFALSAMQAFLAAELSKRRDFELDRIAELAAYMADAMLKQLDNPTTNSSKESNSSAKPIDSEEPSAYSMPTI